MPAFDSLLNLVSVEVDVFYNGTMCGNWSIYGPSLEKTIFHWVTLSKALFSIDDDPQYQNILVEEGDLIILPNDIKHHLHPIKPDDTTENSQVDLPYPRDILTTTYSEKQEIFGMLCGAVHFSHLGSKSFLNALPKVIIIKKEGGWIETLLQLLYHETQNGMKGSNVIINKLAELVFCHAIRWYLERVPEKKGILSLYTNPTFAPLIEKISDHPEQEWSLESMAAICSLSRTTFATKFKSMSGWTPNKYITWFRMQRAWQLLEEGYTTSIVAEKVGYFSDAAFSKVFVKEFGKTPFKVRKGK